MTNVHSLPKSFWNIWCPETKPTGRKGSTEKSKRHKGQEVTRSPEKTPKTSKKPHLHVDRLNRQSFLRRVRVMSTEGGKRETVEGKSVLESPGKRKVPISPNPRVDTGGLPVSGYICIRSGEGDTVWSRYLDD